ncbi:fasciclin domain-containing protein [Pelagerythrobacter sp.]|uniref:fasciclin domain-containing protein n=1 Tax=Pelagerythrobacter sp. TaxID=2800702 RepID=UPI0035AFFCAF
MRLPSLMLAGVAAVSLAACSSEPAADTTPDDAMATDAMGDDMAASTNPTVGGAPMMADMTIVENASKAPNLTTLVSAVTQAGLGETLSGAGPFTVFAPTNDAFSKVPKATLDGLMADDGKDDLTKVLTYHVVPGKLTAADLAAQIEEGGGTATLTTVEGEDLTLTMDGDMVKIAGMGGSTAMVNTADVMQSNGVVHVIDGVLTPTL